MATRLIALAILALTLLPICALLPGGEQDPEFVARLVDWAYGIALCAGIGGLVAYVTRVRQHARERGRAHTEARPGETPPSASRRAGAGDPAGLVLVPAVGSAGPSFARGLAFAAFLLYCITAWGVFNGKPLLIDEIVQVLQARWYAAGSLSIATPEHREFYSILHLVDLGDRSYSQFPAGGPAMLALGSLVGAEWLVGPLVGALSVLLFASLLRTLEPDASRRWHRLALVLFAVTPFGVFMFASHMNHATTLLWLLVATIALARAMDPSPKWGFITGLALGAAATIRPVDAAAFALPAAVWLAWRARRGGRGLAAFLLSGVGVAVPMAALLWVNARTTGAPLLFGYDLLWGSGHGIGFHRSPWGPIHTPLRGIELVSLYVTRLSVYLFETPFPALLPAAGAFWWRRSLRPLDRYLLASAGLLLGGYWAYWHDGFYLGPRFMVPLIPLLVLWSARLPLALQARFGDGRALWNGLTAGLGFGAAYALLSIAMVRVPQYRNGMTSMRIDVASASREANVRDALVLVKESWGAQLVVRLWALDVSRSDTEVLYRTTDACKLELTIRSLEADGVRGLAALARLKPLQADSSRLVPSDRSPDFTERMLPGYRYAPECEARLRDDEGGFSHYAPYRLAQDGNVYVRWLPGREREIAAQFAGRPVYLLARESSAVGAPLVWRRLTP